ncbi:capsule biosynthesis protein [Methylocella sp. CPCC 101449]|jgi:capsular polysaccharide transport system permease protein|uniref:capsule biosynthesis protein n=1 Tax=Methylocella sp. CPCC 101449 TaxID=2987531 RepID=UPI00288EA2FF|nr:capsule biosynthesis protein [Methylocella sp. CPCC 101449]MDT2022901.1 capsule biosynthesis protein [Methylocella sp. CPCC 101449]HEV2570454.1 capsule biosynthesis protein [Beijerinckiaceae bacterium]
MSLNLPDVVAGFSRPKAVLAPGSVNHILDKAERRARLIKKLILAVMIVPPIFAVFYYGLFAADRYVSEANIIVRSVSSKRAAGGLDMVLQTFGISRAVDDTNAVQNFMLSRDAVRALESRLPLREIFSNSNADIFTRFPRFWLWKNDAFERLYEYYLDRVTVIQDPSKGITTVRAVAFRPEDALRITQELLKISEEMVNRMNVRAQADTVKSAQLSVDDAGNRLIEAQKELTRYRNRELIVDPSKTSQSVLDTITSLATEYTQTQAQVQEMTRLAPNNPAIAARQARADALRARITEEREKLAGSDAAMAKKIEGYEQLAAARDIAEKGLATASNSLETARQEARRQQIYVEQIVSPNLPDQSTEPERIRMILTYLVVSCMLGAILWLLNAGTQEHAN